MELIEELMEGNGLVAIVGIIVGCIVGFNLIVSGVFKITKTLELKFSGKVKKVMHALGKLEDWIMANISHIGKE